MDGAALSVECSAWTLGRLLHEAGLSAIRSRDASDIPLTQLTDDSRAVVPGACFVAVRGGQRDGHDFVAAAITAGARCVITETSVAVPPDVVAIRVSDTRSALARLAAAYHRLRPGQRAAPLRLVGVTGTNGKSTTCELLRAILVAGGSASGGTALLGTIRYDLVGQTLPASLTTPPALELCGHLARAAEAGARWAVMEASSHALDQRRCDGLDFAAGVFTNISGDHLDYHGDTASYVRAKKRLFDGLAEDAVAVVNADDAYAEAMVADCRARLVRYGLKSDRADVTAEIGSLTAEGSKYTIIGPDGRITVSSPLIGRHNVLNALAAAGAAGALGFDDQAIKRGLESVSVVRGRLERVQLEPPACGRGGQDFAVLVDYAHTDDALRQVLSALAPVTRGRLVCVFGCGGDRDRTKRPRMAAAVAAQADLAVVTSDNPRSEDPNRIIEEVLTGFSPGGSCRVVVEPDRAAAIQLAIAEAQTGDTVLIAGKGHEDYQIVGRTRRHFDDVEVARACLAARFGLPVTPQGVKGRPASRACRGGSRGGAGAG